MKLATAIAAATWLGLCTPSAAQTSATWAPVRNGSYQIVGYTEQRSTGDLFVRDCHGRILGYINGQGTFLENGRKVSPSGVSSALMGDVPGCPAFDRGMTTRGK